MDARAENELTLKVTADEMVAPEPSPEEEWRLLVEELKTRDPNRRLHIAQAFSEIGTAAVPFLVAGLEGASPKHQEAILSTLGLLGRQARAAIPAIEKLREDEQVGPAAREAI